jgi:hypothetical protein
MSATVAGAPAGDDGCIGPATAVAMQVPGSQSSSAMSDVGSSATCLVLPRHKIRLAIGLTPYAVAPSSACAAGAQALDLRPRLELAMGVGARCDQGGGLAGEWGRCAWCCGPTRSSGFVWRPAYAACGWGGGGGGGGGLNKKKFLGKGVGCVKPV